MSTRAKYNQGVALLMKGDVAGAKPLLLEVYNLTHDMNLKIDSAVSLISALNQADDHQLMLQVCNEGIRQARAQNRQEPLILLLMRRAVTLLQKLSLIVWAQKNITMMKTWFQFAHEEEQNEHRRLQELFENHQKDANASIDEAMSLPTDGTVRFHVLLDAAHAKEQLAEATNLASARPKKILGRIWMRTVNKEQRRLSRQLLKESRRLCHEAMRVGLESGDQSAPVYCHYQLGLSYRIFFQFWRARYYLMRAKYGAKKHKIDRIVEMVDMIFSDLRMKKIGGERVDHHDITVD